MRRNAKTLYIIRCRHTQRVCSFLAMLLIDFFALRISSVTLMLTAAAVSLAIFMVKRNAGKADAEK